MSEKSNNTGLIRRLRNADRRHQRDVARIRFLQSLKWILLVLAICLIVDLIFQFSGMTRLSVLMGCGGLLVSFLGFLAYVGWFKRNSPEHVARLLESRDETLGTKLINLLQLWEEAQDPAKPELTRLLATRAVDDAAAEVQERDLQEIARNPSLGQGYKSAGLALGTFALLIAVVFPIGFRQLQRFFDPFGDHPPFSFTTLEITTPAKDDEEVLYLSNLMVETAFKGHAPREVVLMAVDPENPESPNSIPMIRSGDAGFLQEIEGITTDLHLVAQTKGRARSE